MARQSDDPGFFGTIIAWLVADWLVKRKNRKREEEYQKNILDYDIVSIKKVKKDA